MNARELGERLLAFPNPEEIEVYLEHDSTDIAYECIGADLVVDGDMAIIFPGPIFINDYELREED
jgi:hypothetical protein